MRNRHAVYAAALLMLSGCRGGAQPDDRYAADVASPAFAQAGPAVLIDEAHRNMHTARGTYAPFARLLEHDGYQVRRNRKPFTDASLAGARLLVIANARGSGERNDDAAFTAAECDVVTRFVQRGGALLLITDHYPIGDANRALSERFAVGMAGGIVEDATAHDARWDASHIVFAGGIDHPIWRGRNAAETVRRVLTFTGQSLSVPAGAAAILPLGRHAIDRAATPEVERDGRDVRVLVTYGEPTPAAGRAQGVALSYGKGRVVILGEAALASAQLSGHDNSPFGMNVAGYDNQQFVLNVVHWLTRVLA